MTIAEPPHPPGHSPEEKAEAVRAYLVAVRGGAPFLSAADGRLLVKWIEQGISVARILAAVDEVAEKRRKKMTRGRLTLSACRRSVEGKSKRATKELQPTQSASMPLTDFSPYIAALENMVVPTPLEQSKTTLIESISALSNTVDSEHAATGAVSACRAFQETAWGQAQAEHEALRLQALEELSALQSVLSPEALESAVEEVARDIVRRRFPLVSAREVWDRVSTE